jgi:hypothetical protein
LKAAVKVYKYLRADYAMQAVEHKRLKVSFLDDLNDIYDCRPRIIYDESSAAEMNKAFEGEFTKNFVGNIGINCYCGKADNLLLWSHYGDSHKGIALGFNLDEGDFRPLDEPADLRILVKVSYPPENAPKVINWKNAIEIPNLSAQQQFEEILTKGYSIKGLDWEYEDEYREFVHLGSSIPSGTLYFSRFRPGSLCEVILGERCSLKPQFVSDLIKYSKRNERGYETRVLRAHTRNDSFKMRIEDAFGDD